MSELNQHVHDLDLPTCVELGYVNFSWNLLPDAPADVKEGDTVVVTIYFNGERIVNVERDDDLLTAEEVKQHHDAVRAAVLKELLTWAKMQCMSRRERSIARNIIDCK